MERDSVTEGACVNFKDFYFLFLLRTLPQSPTATAPSQREPPTVTVSFYIASLGLLQNPPSEREVARDSVTEGACENFEEFIFFFFYAFSFSRLRRQLPPRGSLENFVRLYKKLLKETILTQ